MASVDTQTQADYAVLTPERITLQYDVAGIGSRSAAALIDTAIQVAVLALLTVLVALVARLVGASARSLDVPDASTLGVTVMMALFVVCVFAVLFGYYILFEIIWNGQTPGKRMLGLRVLRENGYPLRAGDATVRNLVRIVDAPPFGAVNVTLTPGPTKFWNASLTNTCKGAVAAMGVP